MFRISSQLALLSLLFLSISIQAQQVDWLNNGGGTSFDAGLDITSDGAGNSFGIGTVFANAAQSARWGTDSIHPGTNRSYEAYVVKHDVRGNRKWLISMGGTGPDIGSGIQMDSDTTFVVCGIYSSSNAKFDTINGPAASGTVRLFVARYDTAGNVLWLSTASIGSVPLSPFNNFYNPRIAVNDDGDVFVTGVFRGSATFGSTSLSAASAFDFDNFLAKFSVNGTQRWAKKYGGTGFNFSGGVAADTAGNVYVAGTFAGTTTIDTISVTASGSRDFYVAQFNDTGRVQWAFGDGGTGFDEAYGIAIDKFNNLYVGGHFTNSFTFDTVSVSTVSGNFERDIFLARLTTEGRVLWVEPGGGSTNSNDFLYALDTDDRGNVGITGQFGGTTANFGSNSVTGNGAFRSIYFALADSTGDFFWAVAGSGSSFAFNQGNGIALDSDKNIYATGQGDPPLVFDNISWSTGAGLRDAFIIKISDCTDADTAIINGPTTTAGCLGDTFHLSSNNKASLDYQWLLNNVPIVLQTDSVYDAYLNGTYNVVVIDDGCIDTSASLAITVNALPNVTLSNFSAVCSGQGRVTLNQGSPVGGAYTGIGMINDTVFDPDTSGIGTFGIWYTFTDTSTSCADSAFKQLQVVNVTASLAAIPNKCIGDAPFSLTGGSPAGGSFFVNGSASNSFNPNTLGVGTHTVEYVVNSNGCTDTVSQNVDVNASPTATLAALSPVCQTTFSVGLTGGSPAGGTYSGPGVAFGSNFFPSFAGGPGTYSIDYIVTNASGCADTANQSITVDPTFTINFSPATTKYCLASDDDTLSATPVGGVFSGTGIINDSIFSPSTAGAGTFAIKYKFSNTCATDSVIRNFDVSAGPTASLSALPSICEGANPITLTQGSPAGGTYFGSGVSAGQFDPSVTGDGTFTLFYTVVDTNGCADTASNTIVVHPQPSVSLGALTAVCVDAGSFALSGGSPAGGTYAGTGVTGGNFSPSTAGVGTWPITYSFTDGNACTDSATQNQVVDSLPTVTFAAISNLCANAGPITLSQGSPAGGTYSGTGVTGNSFNPATSGVGTFTLTYSFTDGNGCNNTATQSVTVDPLPTVTLGAISALCAGSDAITLTQGSPAGGTYFGTGVTGTSFNPATAGAGTVQIGYSFTNGSGCTDTAFRNVTVHPQPSVSLGALTAVCVDAGSFALSGGSPAGGTYAGTGVTGGNFSPSTAGVGTWPITYSFTDGNACTDSATQNQVVDSLPTVTFAAISNLCANAGPITLSQGSPAGGTYSGTGVTGNSFNPATSGVGTFTLTYSFTDGNGCNNTATQSVTVDPLPTVTLGAISALCAGSDAITLTQGSPAGGTYFGTGVTGTSFNPATAGAGTVQIGYSFTNGSGCTDTAFRNVTVHPQPSVSLGALTAVCVDAGSFALSGGSPAGGTYAGTGVTGGNFSPSTAGVGTWPITYSFTDGNACTDSATQNQVVDSLPTVTFAAISNLCANAGPITLSQGSPAGGTYSGTGVTGNSFNPATSGVGTFTLTYSFTDGNGCNNTATQSVTVDPLPTVTLGAISALCAGSDAITLTQGSPAGGTYFGTGVTGTSFDPATAGAGTVQIGYSFTDGSGCTDTAFRNVTVHPQPSVSLGALTAVCVDAGSFALSGGSPAGGTYAGTGVTGGNFSPSTAGVGTWPITYSFTDGNACTDSATQNQVVDSLPTVTFAAISNLCANAGPITLSQGSPAGGTYSGTGVTGNSFNPATSGVGTFTLTYSFTDGNGCNNTATQSVTVDPLPTVTLGAISALCAGSDAITLTQGSPAGGTYFGTGVTGTSFNPATAGAGTVQIGYSFTNGSGCTDTAFRNVTVHPQPSVSLGALTAVCVDAGSFALSGGSPAGGTYAGTGVTGGNFSPSTAGVGTWPITYSFTDGNACTDSATQNQVVDSLPTVTFAAISNLCANAGPITLSQGSPAGGTYSGTGVTGNSFNPATSGVGTFTLTYSFTDGNGCNNTATQSVTVDPLPTVTLGAISALCAGSDAITLTQGSPAGGTYFGTGVTGTSFNPATAGAGTVQIGYSFTNGSGCTDTAFRNVTVHPQPSVSLGALTAVCVDAGSFALSGGSPAGGTYAGTGVTGGNFSPSTAGVGTWPITYSFTDGNACTDSATQNQVVDSLPTVTFAAISNLCANAGPITLSQGSPAGGTYSGTGVTGNSFNPATSGVGTFTLTYSFTDGNGCNNTATQSVTVDTVPIVSLTAISALCVGSDTINLTQGSPAGGTYFGTGVSGTSFDPATAGAGTVQIGYGFTDANSCTDTAYTSLVVNAQPTVSFSSLSNLCENSDSLTLSQGSPAGGNYSGTGTFAGAFYPDSATAGTYSLTYTFTDVNSCTDSASQTIVVDTVPIVQFSALNNVCGNANTVALTQGSPVGGTYSGLGVTGTSFDPTTSGAGTFTLKYEFTDANSCADSAFQTIGVDTIPIVNLNPFSNVCFGDTAQILSNGSPAGGVYSGTGVVLGTSFDPNISGAGSFVIQYKFTNINGCADSVSQSITVDSLPTVSMSSFGSICQNTPEFALSGGLPIGGNYQGTRVRNDSLIANLVSTTGLDSLQYIFTNLNGCTDSALISFSVDTVPNVLLSAFPSQCLNSDTLVLNQASPAGGTYQGQGVSGTSFDPNIGVGVYSISYFFTDGNSCTDSVSSPITVDTVPIVNFPALSNLCIGNGDLTLNTASPSGGVYSGDGIIASNLFNPDSSLSLNPTIKYTYTDANSCSDSAFASIQIDTLPSISFIYPDTICKSRGFDTLIGGFPLGGIYKGNGILADSILDLAVLPIGPQQITYEYTNAQGCTDSSTITTYINPDALSSLSLSFTEICENEDAFSLSGGVPAGGRYFGTAVVNGNYVPSLTLGERDTVYYELGNFCSLDTSRAIVQINPAPEISSTEGQFCANETLRVLDIASPKGGLYSGTGVINDTLLDISSLDTGNYSFIYSFSDGVCNNTAIIDYRINQNPELGLDLDTTICVANELVLSLDSNYNSVSWMDRDTSNEGLFEGRDLNVGVNSIDVRANMGGVCDGFDTVHVIVEPCTRILLKPNPSVGRFTLDLNLTIDDEITVSVYNNLGQVIYNLETLVVAGLNSIPFDLKDLRSGIYVIKIKGQFIDESEKLIVR